MAIAATPTNFWAQAGNGNVSLLWDLMSGATSYSVQRSPDGVTFTTLATPTNNNYLDTTATLNTQYYYQVASVNGSGTSLYTTAQAVIPTLTGIMTLSQARLAAQQRADRVDSQFVTLPEWNSYINQAYFELYELLVTLFEDYYVAAPVMFSTTGSAQYALPDGVSSFINYYTGQSFIAPSFYKLLGVDCGLATTTNAFVTLHKYEFIARNRYVFPNITSTFYGVYNMQYRVMGSFLQFIPTPAAGQYIRMWYIPRVNQLLQEADLLDGVSGWTEYVIVRAAYLAMVKEESDASPFAEQVMAIKSRIEESAQNRDAGEPSTISATRNWAGRGEWGDPSDGNWGGA